MDCRRRTADEASAEEERIPESAECGTGEEGAAGLKVGDTGTVKGPVRNDSGTVESDAGCTCSNIVKAASEG